MKFFPLGIQTDIPCNADGLGSVIAAFTATAIPLWLKANSCTSGILDLLRAGRMSGVPHQAIFRRSAGPGQANYDLPDYSLAPDIAAMNHVALHLNDGAFPPEMVEFQDHLWLEIINEPDKNLSDWIGRFCLAAAQRLAQQGIRFAGPGFASGEPELDHWQTPGMLDFLRYAAANRDTCAVALHEYSLNPHSLRLTGAGEPAIPWLIGRFRRLTSVYDVYDIPVPRIIISEFGYAYDLCPPVDALVEELSAVLPIYAAAGVPVLFWTLGAAWGQKLANRAKQLMRRLPGMIDTWSVDLPDPGTGAVPAPQEPPEPEPEPEPEPQPAPDPVIISPPAAGAIDLLPYLRGLPGRQHVLQCNIDGHSSTETLETQLGECHSERSEESACPWYQVKNRAWEMLYADEHFIYRAWDTSEAPDRFYGQFTGERLGATWLPRRMIPGEVYTRTPLVRHLSKNNCAVIAEQFVTSDIRLASHEPIWQSLPADGFTLPAMDTIVLEWLVDGEVEERYRYARDFGLVGWLGRGRGSSLVCEIHTGRPPLVREQIPCLPSCLLYLALQELEEQTVQIIDVIDQLRVHPVAIYARRDLTKLQAHVIHHSASASSASVHTINKVADYHVGTLGWPGIGYTYIILGDGAIYQVNGLETMSAGVANHNDIYLSTCLIGNFQAGSVPTAEQLASAAWLHNTYLPSALGRHLPLLGHKECLGASTICPGSGWDWHAIDQAPPEPEPQPLPARVRVNAGITLNIRTGPGATYPDVGDLHPAGGPDSGSIEVIARSGDWYCGAVWFHTGYVAEA